MITTVERLRRYAIHATDGDIGHIDNIFFDDANWAIRYVVVNVGNWLIRQYILLQPSIIDHLEPEGQIAVVPLSREQIQNSPEIDPQQPLSRDNEESLHQYFDWEPYWRTLPMMTAGLSEYVAPVPIDTPPEGDMSEAAKEEEETAVSVTLRSSKEVISYNVFANDSQDAIGYVENLLIDTERWYVRYIVAQTGTWLSGRRVLLAPQWVRQVSWADASIYLSLSNEQISQSPDYDPQARLLREYEAALYGHYDKRPYWEERP
jgi:hypothetical protein